MSLTTWQPRLPHSEVPPQGTLPLRTVCSHDLSRGDLPARGLKLLKQTVQVCARTAA